MENPRVRFTVRRLMAVVAVVAVVLGWNVMGERSSRFRDLAAHHSRKEDEYRRLQFLYILSCDQDERTEAVLRQKLYNDIILINNLKKEINVTQYDNSTLIQITERSIAENRAFLAQAPQQKNESRESLRRSSCLIAYHAALKLKYERFAARPWLPVAPDPPEPK